MCCAASDPRRPLAALALALLTSCASLSIDVPPPFLQLETAGDELKATTPDDARIWVREFADPDEGDATFWIDALDHDLQGRGYRAEGDVEEARDRAGRIGRARTYSTDVDGREHGYLVAVFVVTGWRGQRVRVAEFVAPRVRFDELLPSVRAALATLAP